MTDEHGIPQNNSDTPVVHKKSDRIHASIWRQKGQDASDKNAWFTVKIQRRYQDAQGEWKSTSTYTVRDLPHVQLAIAWAMRELDLQDA